jgi:solute:Na+ symporter, SSS family
MAEALDYVAIGVYLVVLLAVGYYGARMTETEEDFWVAGRRLPLWMYGPTMAAVILGGASTIGGTELGHESGLSGAWLVIWIGLGITALGLLLSTRLSQLSAVSLSEALYTRFGDGARYVSALIIIVNCLLLVVTQMTAVGEILRIVFGWELWIGILVGGGVIIAYTVAGGMWSVTITDFIQFLIMTLGVFFLLLPLGLFEVGGWSGLEASVEPELVSPVGVGLQEIGTLFVLYFFGMIVGQDIWQRVFTAKDDATARTGTILAGGYSVVYGITAAVLGLIALVLLDLPDGGGAFPALTLALLPPGVAGIVLAAAISATMSTADSNLLASSTVLVNDVLDPVLDTESDSLVNWTRVLILGFGVLAIAISVLIQDVITALNIAYALLTGGLFVPVLAAFFWRRATSTGVVAAMSASIVVILAGLSLEGIDAISPILYGIATNLAVLVVVSLLTTDE